ncbi:hypothetical protein WAF17_16860 [Bernardetia sp. ABR2-2B]|uniref:hypothetical protein n=1 Tax=Bernardetia sp. ABR2-2B TaxID=3127472 RepID=UPI0030CD205E
MKTNFEIIENYALNFEEKHFDLHNNFDFLSFEYSILKQEIKMEWKKSNDNWVDKNEVNNLILVHKSVSYLFFNNEVKENNLNENQDLSEITFFPSKIREVNDNFLLQNNPKENDDIIYTFENGQVIRICCKKIELMSR